LAPEDCDTITSITAITRRRQEGSFEPGLGTSVGDTKPVLLIWFDLVIWLIWFIWSSWFVWFNQINKTNQLNETDQLI
jgi:hypothetical protein